MSQASRGSYRPIFWESSKATEPEAQAKTRRLRFRLVRRHVFDALRPTVARLIPQQSPRRFSIVHLRMQRPAGGIDDGKARPSRRFHGTGEEATGIAGAEIHILGPIERIQLLNVLARARHPA